MNNIKSSTNARRPTVSKYKLSESLPCNMWFNSETLEIDLDDVTTTLSDASFLPRIRDLCGNLAEERMIKGRTHFRISAFNKGVLINRVFNSENRAPQKSQKITTHRLSEGDKLLNLVLSA